MKPLQLVPVFLALSFPALSSAGAGQPTLKELVAQQVRRLDPKILSKEERLKAAEWLARNCASKEADAALPALERSLRQDPDAQVRAKAAEALGSTLYQRKAACRLSLVEAVLEDKDEDVRAISFVFAATLEKLPKESLPILTRCLEHELPSIRSHGVMLWPRAAGKDEKALAPVRRLTQDKHPGVRNDARHALFRATGKLEDIVPYCLLEPIALRELNARQKPVTDADKRDMSHRNLIQLGAAMLLVHLAVRPCQR
jgi:HEAT repeat protein